LDDHRHRAGGLEHRADIDIVELLEFEPVDRDHGVRKLHFLVQMNAQEPADVAVAGQHQRMAILQDAAEALDHAATECVEPQQRCGRAAGRARPPARGTTPPTGAPPPLRSSRFSITCVALATADGSMVSPSSGSAGAITGTLRSGTASSGAT